MDNCSNPCLGALCAAQYLGLSVATLAKLRCVGGSPDYLKLGRRIVYERSALDSWLAARRAKSTSDAARLPRRLTDELPPAA
jgi:hypothetical protein